MTIIYGKDATYFCATVERLIEVLSMLNARGEVYARETLSLGAIK